MAKKVTVINAISDSKHTQPQQRLKVPAQGRRQNLMPHRWSITRKK